MDNTTTSFKEIKILDNFYQTSSFFPMPIVGITTISETGQTNIGPYSLIFPYHIAGKDYYTMILLARNNSNTSKNILRTRKCALNFLPDKKKYMKECVSLGFPGETTEEKMENCIFELEKGQLAQKNPDEKYPLIIKEAFQVFECTWLAELEGADKFKVEEEYKPPFNNFNGITSEMGAHFILKIENILLKPEFHESIVNGVKSRNFPKVPVDYGYRDNTNFWISRFKKPYCEPIPKGKEMRVDAVRYAADRLDSEVKFTDEACAKLVKVPRIFLKPALKGCVDWAEENNVNILTEEHMDIIRNKRKQEK